MFSWTNQLFVSLAPREAEVSALAHGDEEVLIMVKDQFDSARSKIDRASDGCFVFAILGGFREPLVEETNGILELLLILTPLLSRLLLTSFCLPCSLLELFLVHDTFVTST